MIISKDIDLQIPVREALVSEIEYFANEESPDKKLNDFMDLLCSDRIHIQIKLLENLHKKGLLK